MSADKKIQVEVSVSAKEQAKEPQDEKGKEGQGQAEGLQIDPEAGTGVVDADSILNDFGKTTSEREYADALDKQMDADEAVWLDSYRAFCRLGGPNMKLTNQQESPEAPEEPTDIDPATADQEPDQESAQ